MGCKHECSLPRQLAVIFKMREYPSIFIYVTGLQIDQHKYYRINSNENEWKADAKDYCFKIHLRKGGRI
jgi:hypothetical protein